MKLICVWVFARSCWDPLSGENRSCSAEEAAAAVSSCWGSVLWHSWLPAHDTYRCKQRIWSHTHTHIPPTSSHLTTGPPQRLTRVYTPHLQIKGYLGWCRVCGTPAGCARFCMRLNLGACAWQLVCAHTRTHKCSHTKLIIQSHTRLQARTKNVHGNTHTTVFFSFCLAFALT